MPPSSSKKAFDDTNLKCELSWPNTKSENCGKNRLSVCIHVYVIQGYNTSLPWIMLEKLYNIYIISNTYLAAVVCSRGLLNGSLYSLKKPHIHIQKSAQEPGQQTTTTIKPPSLTRVIML